MSTLANLLPFGAFDIAFVSEVHMPCNGKPPWAVRVRYHWEVRGHTLRRYETCTEAAEAAHELEKFITSVKRIAS